MPETTIIKCRCMSCTLHFAVYSDNSEWMPEFCPECGSSLPFMVWKESTDQFIFQLVPGENAVLVEIG